MKCACNCGKSVKGKAVYFSAACRKRAQRARPEKPVYPRELVPGVRVNFCAKHQREFREITHPGAERGSVFAGCVQLWTGACESCEEERAAQIEANKRIGQLSPEARREEDWVVSQLRKQGTGPGGWKVPWA